MSILGVATYNAMASYLYMILGTKYIHLKT